MLQCNRCEHTFKGASFSGWIVKGTGFCELDQNGRIEIVSPIVPMVSIEPGKEIMHANIEITCPRCNNAAPVAEYKLIRPCVLTGANASVRLVIFNGIEIYIAPGIEAWARANLSRVPVWATEAVAIDAAVRKAYAAYTRV